MDIPLIPITIPNIKPHLFSGGANGDIISINKNIINHIIQNKEEDTVCKI